MHKRTGLVWKLLVCLLCGPTLLLARPEFFMRFISDPFSRPEKRASCAACHLNPAGGGPRNEFGKAFARNGFRITPQLRAKWTDWFVPSISAEAPAPQTAAPGAPVKATWPAARDNVVLVEIGGEHYVLNRSDASIRKVDEAQARAFLEPAPETGKAVAAAPGGEPAESGPPPATFDHYLINLPTTKPREPHSLSLRFSHRFSDPAFSGRGRGGALFGLDSFAVASFGLEVGLLKHVSFVTYRTPYPHSAGGPTIEMGPSFSLVRQGGRVPLSFALRTTIEGEHNFTERFTANLMPVVSRAFGNRAELFIAPIFNLGVPRRTLTVDFPLTPGEARDNMVGLGIGASIRIRPKAALIGEYTPRIAGFRGLESRHTYAFGIQRATNRHVFALVFSNTQSTTSTRMLTDGLDDLRIGFNLYRRLF